MKFNSNTLRRWCRLVHRDLSYLFAGMVLIYALSGSVMNHYPTSITSRGPTTRHCSNGPASPRGM